MSEILHPDTSDVAGVSVTCSSLPDTMRLGDALASALKVSDLLCISGPLGAGKSELCRAIIRKCAGDPGLEVPSPSYTLVNVYDRLDVHIWHADLYRIADESELHEIGLEDAIADSILLVEWPERWTQLPARRLEVQITLQPADGRLFSFSFHGPNWDAVTATLKACR